MIIVIVMIIVVIIIIIITFRKMYYNVFFIGINKRLFVLSHISNILNIYKLFIYKVFTNYLFLSHNCFIFIRIHLHYTLTSNLKTKLNRYTFLGLNLITNLLFCTSSKKCLLLLLHVCLITCLIGAFLGRWGAADTPHFGWSPTKFSSSY